jgi:hypothetical protein
VTFSSQSDFVQNRKTRIIDNVQNQNAEPRCHGDQPEKSAALAPRNHGDSSIMPKNNRLSYQKGYQPSLLHPTVPPSSTELPANFPNVQTPRYLYGDKLRWICNDDKADWGIAIGRFYSFAPHHCAWMWCYLIWLDKLSPSANRIVADIAWENDLEPVAQEKIS